MCVGVCVRACACACVCVCACVCFLDFSLYPSLKFVTVLFPKKRYFLKVFFCLKLNCKKVAKYAIQQTFIRMQSKMGVVYNFISFLKVI